MNKYLMIGIGGFLGSVARYWVGAAIGNRMGTRFPYGTFAINITGSFLLGMIMTVLADKMNWNANLRYLVPIGFIGAYTTFSTFEWETFRSVQEGQLLVALLNVVLSVVIGFLALWGGVITGKAIG